MPTRRGPSITTKESTAVFAYLAADLKTAGNVLSIEVDKEFTVLMKMLDKVASDAFIREDMATVSLIKGAKETMHRLKDGVRDANTDTAFVEGVLSLLAAGIFEEAFGKFREDTAK